MVRGIQPDPTDSAGSGVPKVDGDHFDRDAMPAAQPFRRPHQSSATCEIDPTFGRPPVAGGLDFHDQHQILAWILRDDVDLDTRDPSIASEHPAPVRLETPYGPILTEPTAGGAIQ
jgi:hypothetical protein